jgi:uncharacterized delta-60 repeat protein
LVNGRLASVPGFALVVLLAVAAWPAAARAQAAVDPTFGPGGRASVVNPIHNGTFYAEDAHDAAVQPDGKTLVTADGSGPLGEHYWTVLRFLPDGQLDPGFGNGGTVVLIQTDSGLARGIDLQPDGRIVVTGDAFCGPVGEACFGAARLMPDGQLDPSFGDGGIARHDPIRRTYTSDVAVQPDGRIVLVGRTFKPGDANDDDVGCAMRLLPDGRLDRSFSRNGVVRVDHGHGDDALIGVEMQGRRIVAGGEGRVTNSGTGGFAAVRLRRNGSLDRSFGRRGRRIVLFGRGRWARPASFDLAPGGKIVLGGNAGTDFYRWQPAAARLTRNGAMDRSFSRDGRVLTRITPFGGEAGAAMGDARGGVLVAGQAYTDTARDPSVWALVRYTRAGRLDRGFAPGGILRTDFGSATQHASILVPWSNGLLAGGTVGSSLSLARYLP